MSMCFSLVFADKVSRSVFAGRELNIFTFETLQTLHALVSFYVTFVFLLCDVACVSTA